MSFRCLPAFVLPDRLVNGCLLFRIKHRPGEIPKTLDDYLHANLTCICGKACFEYKYYMTAIYDINRISQSFTYLNKNGFDNQVPLKVSICSLKCYKKNCHVKGLW